MSLEQAIEQNTLAVLALTKALQTFSTPNAAVAQAYAGNAQPAPSAPTAAAPASPSASPPAATAPSGETQSADTGAAVPLTRDSAKENAKRLNAKDAEKLKAILSGLGAKNFSAVPDDKLAEFDAQVREALK